MPSLLLDDDTAGLPVGCPRCPETTAAPPVAKYTHYRLRHDCTTGTWHLAIPRQRRLIGV